MSSRGLQSRAWMAVVLFGLVSLFADMTYEGARSVIGPCLGYLGASALRGFLSRPWKNWIVLRR